MIPSDRHDPDRFYHCECIDEGREHDHANRFYHCDCLEGGYDPNGKLAERLEAAEAELARLRTVIRTGGAMYRAERAAMGIPGGHDTEQHESKGAL